MDLRFFDTLESTNKYCELLDPASVGEFTVVCARRQTSGIGQRGNVWVSEPYKNLTFSIVLKPLFLKAAEQYSLTMALAVAVAETVTTLLSGKRAVIKWPNDIYVEDRKICGILTSNQLVGDAIRQSVCGIGLNVNQTLFPDWVPNPTSLRLEADREFDVEAVLASLLESVKDCYEALGGDAGSLRDRYMSRLYRLGMESEYIYKGKEFPEFFGKRIRATIVDVNDFGHLQLVDSDSRLLTCSLKEVEYVLG